MQKTHRGVSGTVAALVAAVVFVGGPGVARAGKVEKLEQDVERLRNEVQELKAEKDEGKTSPMAGNLLSSVRLGGYGSVRFEQNDAEGVNTTFTFRRFVLTTDATLGPKLRFSLELEFERFRKLELERSAVPEAGGIKIEQEVEGTSDSEIALEQAWLQYDLTDAVGFRFGGVLVPLGRFNLKHDDNQWDLPRRSLVDRGAPALPAKAAWDELGAGFTGKAFVGDQAAVDYHLYVVNGVAIEPEVEEIIQTRGESRDKLELEAKFTPQTGTFSQDVKDAKAVTGRFGLSPALGHELAGSFYWGRYTPDFLPDESVASFGVDGITRLAGLELEGQWIFSDFGDVRNVARAFARTALEQSRATPSEASPEFESEIEFELDSLAEQRHGYWIEARHDFRPAWLVRSLLGRPFEDPLVTAVFRGEQVWVKDLITELDFSEGQVTSLDTTDQRVDRITFGGAYRPVPLVVFQLAYEFTRSDDATLGDATNFLPTGDDEAHAILFGAAFGF